MNKKISIFIAVIIGQIIITGLLLHKILVKSEIQGANVSVVPLSKEDLKENKGSILRYFYEPVPNLTIRDPEWSKFYHGEYRINSDSLREDQDYSVKKESDVFRIVTIGDSWTYGLFVDGENIWPEYIERMLNENPLCKNYKKHEVINLGFPGYDIQYSVERYRLRGQKYDPDLVIWFLKEDDFLEMRDILGEQENQIIQRMKQSGEFDERIKQGIPYPQAEEMYQYSLRWLEETGEENLLIQQEQSFNELFDYFNKKLVVATFYINNERIKDILAEKEKQNKITVFSDFTNLTQIPDATFLPDDYHPTALGHKSLADELFQYINEKNIIPCSK